MSYGATWRAKFIELADALRFARNEPAAVFVDDPDTPLQMVLEVDGIEFEAIHFDQNENRFLVQCRFGPISRPHCAALLKAVLAANLALARAQSAMFALHTETDDLVYSFFESLEYATAPVMLEGMAQMAEMAGRLRADHAGSFR